jgi:hypothetical protein
LGRPQLCFRALPLTAINDVINIRGNTLAIMLRVVLLFAIGFVSIHPSLGVTNELWQSALKTVGTHRFSTLFTAQDVRDSLSTPEGRAKAIQWCRDTAVTKVYVESYRNNYSAEKAALITARDEFKKAGFVVSGCVTTTQVGKKSTGWSLISCYTDPPTQQRIKQIFEGAAELFDEIMIDDFWFTDCKCPECDAARATKTVTIGDKNFPVNGDSWDAYHSELMVRMSQEYVLGAAKRVNPNVKLIIKYPQWYDGFHERGYEVIRETADFDRIWVGTETRDYNNKQWGGTVQYEGYFLMRWLGEIGGKKCGGGWYDWLGTTEKTYIEQARQTILAGAKESMLFCYGGLQSSTGPKNIAALRQNIPELQRVAAEVQKRKAIGVAAYKPANSAGEKEARVFDYVGMIGIPLAPTHEFPANARAAFFSIHALKDPQFATQFGAFIKAGRTALITDGLANRLPDKSLLQAKNVSILNVNGDPKSLLKLEPVELKRISEPLLHALKLEWDAPNHVALYPFSDGSWVAENFNDEAVDANVGGKTIHVEARGWQMLWK